MADITATITEIKNTPGMRVATWGPLANGDTGKPVFLGRYADKCAHILGTFGSGGSVTLQGSNSPLADPEHPSYNPATSSIWVALVDPQGNAITKTAAAIEQLLESPVWVRPICTAGDGTTALNCILASKN